MVEVINDEKDLKKQSSDKYKLTFILFYALGLIAQVPSNFYVTANAYWMFKFRDPSRPFDPQSANKTELQVQFTSNFTIISHVCTIIFLSLTAFFLKNISVYKRIVFSQFCMLILFIITMVFVVIDTDSWQNEFYGLTLAMGCILNGASAMSMLSSFRLGFKFPSTYLAAQMSGQAVCGIFASVVQILSQINGQENYKTNAVIYFGFGAICILSTIVLYIYVSSKSEFFIQYESVVIERLGNGDLPFKRIIIDVFYKIKYYLFSMVITLGTTTIIHPGLTALVQSVGHGSVWNTTFFIPTITYLLYNCCDLIGREIAVKLKMKNAVFLLVGTLIRIGIIPLIMLCNATPRQHMPVVFNSDTAYIIIIAIFSVTNGYFINSSIVGVPGVTTKSEEPYVFILVIVLMLSSLTACSLLNSLLIKLL